MKKFLWAVALLSVGFFIAKYLRGKQVLTAPGAPAYATGGPGTSVDK